MKVLIVDDSELMRTVIEQVVRENLNEAADKITFFHAADGQDAMQIFNDSAITLILLDWNMPILNGVDFVKEIRAKGSKVPIVMITSVTDSERILEAATAGVNSYVEKPIQGMRLWDQIAAFFKNAEL